MYLRTLVSWFLFPLASLCPAALLCRRVERTPPMAALAISGGNCVRPCHPPFSLFSDFAPGNALFFHFSAKNLSNFSGSAFTFIRNFFIINKSLEMRKPSSKSKWQREKKRGLLGKEKKRIKNKPDKNRANKGISEHPSRRMFS